MKTRKFLALVLSLLMLTGICSLISLAQEPLPLSAGLAVKAGMDPFDALKAITINAAKALGVDDRIGSIKAGKDADIVVYDGHPFHYMTKPIAVFIDGEKAE